jgi:uncharacterized integral membrane protein
MEPENRQYLKVSDYDLEGNKKNFQLFLGRITRSPWKAFLGATLFLLLGVFILVSPRGESVKFSNEWSVWIPAGLAIIAALVFFILGIRAVAKRKEN